jgi:hypothetical protein
MAFEAIALPQFRLLNLGDRPSHFSHNHLSIQLFAILVSLPLLQSQLLSRTLMRMYSYNYRLRDRYNCPVVSLAILTDESQTWRPSRYQDELWGCSTEFRFPVVKLLDYEANWAELEASRNPFSVVTMAQLKTKATHNQPQARKALEWTARPEAEVPDPIQRKLAKFKTLAPNLKQTFAHPGASSLTPCPTDRGNRPGLSPAIATMPPAALPAG